jgi:AcrR family transcriptional regulator
MNENLIVELEKAGIVTSTFRKLAPNKKRTLFNSALKAFASEVFDRVSLDNIATGAGISKGSLIQYFTHKENILSFIVEIYLDDYKKHWDDYFHHEHAVRVRDRLSRYFKAHYDYVSSDSVLSGFLFKMMFENSREITSHFVDSVNEVNHEHIQDIIRRSLQTGEIHSGESELDIVELFLEYLNGCFFTWSSDSDRSNNGNYHTQIDSRIKTIFNGLTG